MSAELPLKVAYFIGVVNFEWHSQIEVGNIGILALRRDSNKLKNICDQSASIKMLAKLQK